MLTPPSLSFFLQRLSNVDIGGHLSGSAMGAMGVHILVDNRHLYMSVVKSLLYSLRLSKHNLLNANESFRMAVYSTLFLALLSYG